MGQNRPPPNLDLHPISIGNIIEVYWWGSGGKRSTTGLVVEHTFAIYATIGKNRGLAPTQATKVVFFTPNVASSLVI